MTSLPSESTPSQNTQASPADSPVPVADDRVLRIYPPTDGIFSADLAESSRALSDGNVRLARVLASRVRGSAESRAAEREFASQILSRTSIDPVAIGAGLVSLLVFLIVVYLTLWR